MMETLCQYYHSCVDLILSCCGGGQEDDPYSNLDGERTRLLRDHDRSGSHHNHYYGAPERPQVVNHQGHGPRLDPREEEHGSLNQILNKTTANIIDIGIIDQTPGVLDQQDINERMMIYQKRLAESGAHIATKHNEAAVKTKNIEDINNLQIRMLLETETDPEDSKLISEMSKRVNTVISNIHVEEKESVVVPFGWN